jgi:hypothetical protein
MSKDINLYEIIRTLQGMTEQDLIKAEKEWFDQLQDIAQKMIEGRRSPFYNGDRLTHSYWTLLSLRDHMFNEGIDTPRRNITELTIKALHLSN